MIKRLVVWGGRDSLDSIRHCWRAFHENALKLGIDSIWVNDSDPAARHALRAGDTVLAADVTGKHLPYAPEVDYLLHNWDGAHPLAQALETTPQRLLRLQVWTMDATGEKWAPCRQFDREARTLFQAWGSDLLAEDFLKPVFNPSSLDITFVGAIWSDQHDGTELGNREVIDELRVACAQRGLKWRHLTQVGQGEMVALVREARLAPAFAGAWQVANGYLPCRAFKAPAYGVLGFTNVLQMESLYGAASVAVGSVGECLRVERIDVAATLDAALSLDRGRYLNLVREQQRVVADYTYRESILAIVRAFEEIRS